MAHRDARPADVGSIERRRWLVSTTMLVLGGTGVASSATANAASGRRVARLCTFGDSVLDCRHYNDAGLDPGQLIVANDDARFPAFRGRDLRSRGDCRLEHLAVDGATSDDLAAQARGVAAVDGTVAIVSVGGNDLLRGLAADTGARMRTFEATVRRFVDALPIRPVILATVYDPTLGDDARNFTGVPARIARANHERVNAIVRDVAARAGGVADLHAHFLAGDPSWFTRTIEPSLVGASEIRRVFLDAIERVAS